MSTALRMMGSGEPTLLGVAPVLVEEALGAGLALELQQDDERGLVGGQLGSLAFLELPLRQRGLELGHGVLVVLGLDEHSVLFIGQLGDHLPVLVGLAVEALDGLDRRVHGRELHEDLHLLGLLFVLGDLD